MSGNSYKKNRDDAFGIRFRMLMEYHHLTLKEIAQELGCAVSTVGMWSKGRMPASQENMEKLATLFHVTPDFLANGNHTGNNNDAIGIYKSVTENAISTCSADGHNDLREKIECYFQQYLNQAQNINGGLEYVYYNMLRVFQMDQFPSELN